MGNVETVRHGGLADAVRAWRRWWDGGRDIGVLLRQVEHGLRTLSMHAFCARLRWAARGYDGSRTVVAASSPRGGSTWLAEILACLPGYHILWEPFQPIGHPPCREAGFGWSPYIPPGTADATKREFVVRLMTGANLNARLISPRHVDLRRARDFRGFLVKPVQANLMLAWLLEQHPARAILMIRHPCAVVASQMRHGGWRHCSKETTVLPAALVRDFPGLAEVFETVRTHEELLAFYWTLQTYIPLSRPKPYPWLLTTYEQLVRHGPAELRRLFDYLGEPMPQGVYKQLRRPSKTTKPGASILEGRDPLRGWRKNLSTRQIDRILGVVHRAGIPFYTDALVPDYDRLFGPRPLSVGGSGQGPPTDRPPLEGQPGVVPA